MDVSKIQKYTITDAPEDFLKTHPYFRKYGEKNYFLQSEFPIRKGDFQEDKSHS